MIVFLIYPSYVTVFFTLTIIDNFRDSRDPGVTDVFRSKQKANNGRLIQIEHIDKSFYRGRSNCTSFITSNKRVHAWISAIAEVIYNGEGKKNSNVAWIDKKYWRIKILTVLDYFRMHS
jgi:hypothetical protein